MADVGRHGRHVARFHDHLCTRIAGAAVFDVPDDFVAGLDEPLHAIVTVNDRENVFLRGRAHQTVLYRRAHRGIPCDVGARQITEEIECMNFALESGFRVNFGSVLRNIQELTVDGVAVPVGAIADVARQSDHALCHNALALNRAAVVSVLRTIGQTGFIGSGKRIESFNRPVIENALEHGFDVFRFEGLEKRAAGVTIARVAQAHEQVDRSIVVHCSEHAVKVHSSVEEPPRHVAHERPQEFGDGYDVTAIGKVNVGKILVALEAEFADGECLISEIPACCRRVVKNSSCTHICLPIPFGRSLPSVRR